MTLRPSDLFNLEGKVVLATGGMSGIGLGFLQGCAKQGATVVALDLNTEREAQIVTHLENFGAASAHVFKVDVADEVAVEHAVDATVKSFGRIDCVFANAGVSAKAPTFPEMSSHDWHRLLNVNLHGAFYTLREVARHMKARALAGDPGGSLVACGSLSIFHGVPGMEHYAAAKGALFAMIKSLALDMAPFGVRANMIAPGFIATGLTSDTVEGQAVLEHFARNTPLGRAGQVDDIEGPAAYLASDASRFQTGGTLIIDGGLIIRRT